MDAGRSVLFQVWAKVETAFGLPAGFLGNLAREEDWSFVIKAHALVEAAVSHLIAANIGDVRLAPVFQRLELSNDDTGKLAFAKGLDLLDPQERRFVRTLSQLRNLLVHNVGNVTFSFPKYFAALDTNQRRALLESALYFVKEPSALERWRATAQRDIKFALWGAVAFLVGNCVLNATLAEKEHASRALQLESVKDMSDTFEATEKPSV
jgi:hypothetical protein